MAPMPNQPIQAPVAETPRVSLLRAITATDVTNDQDVGFSFSPEGCGVSGTSDGGPCADPQDFEIPPGPGIVNVFPVAAWAGDKCSTSSVGERDWQGRARRQLAATMSYQIARELQRGEQAETNAGGDPDFVNAYLASVDADEVTSAPTTVLDAVSRLEQGLGDCRHGQRGAIHVPLGVVPYLADNAIVRREGATLLTMIDTLVIADAGYDGSGPGRVAAADGSVWIYATGIPIVRIGSERMWPDRLEDAVDRGTNTIEYRIDRKFAVGWDQCCHLAAEIDIGWPLEGGS